MVPWALRENAFAKRDGQAMHVNLSATQTQHATEMDTAPHWASASATAVSLGKTALSSAPDAGHVWPINASVIHAITDSSVVWNVLTEDPVQLMDLAASAMKTGLASFAKFQAVLLDQTENSVVEMEPAMLLYMSVFVVLDGKATTVRFLTVQEIQIATIKAIAISIASVFPVASIALKDGWVLIVTHRASMVLKIPPCPGPASAKLVSMTFGNFSCLISEFRLGWGWLQQRVLRKRRNPRWSL